MNWQEIWNNYINMAPGVGVIALRLACAMLVGIVIGLEREFTQSDPVADRKDIPFVPVWSDVIAVVESFFRRKS